MPFCLLLPLTRASVSGFCQPLINIDEAAEDADAVRNSLFPRDDCENSAGENEADPDFAQESADHA